MKLSAAQFPKLLSAHLQEANQGYFEHLLRALSFGLQMLVAGMACLLHAVLPFLCQKTGSNAIRSLYAQMCHHQAQQPGAKTNARPGRNLS